MTAPLKSLWPVGIYPWPTTEDLIEGAWLRKETPGSTPYEVPAWRITPWGAGGWALELFRYAGQIGADVRLSAGDPVHLHFLRCDQYDQPAYLSVQNGEGALYMHVDEMRLGSMIGGLQPSGLGPYPSAITAAWVNGTGSARLRGEVLCRAAGDGTGANNFRFVGSTDHGRWPKVVAQPTPGYFGPPPGDLTFTLHRPGDKVGVRCVQGSYVGGDLLVAAAGNRAQVDNAEARRDRQLAVVAEDKTVPAGAAGTAGEIVYAELLL